jgi:hypothetical protein
MVVEPMNSILSKYQFIGKQIEDLPEGSEYKAKQLEFTILNDISYNLAKIVHYMSVENERRGHGM